MPVLKFSFTAQHVGILNLIHFEHSGIILWCLAFYGENTIHQYSQANELRPLLDSVCSCKGLSPHQPIHQPHWWGAESEAGVKRWFPGDLVPTSPPPRARLSKISLFLNSTPADGEGRGEHSLHLCVRKHYAVTFSFHLQLVPFFWVMVILFPNNLFKQLKQVIQVGKINEIIWWFWTTGMGKSRFIVVMQVNSTLINNNTKQLLFHILRAVNLLLPTLHVAVT